MYYSGTKDIKWFVNKHIQDNASFFKGLTVVDVPAGTGLTSESFKKAGANVIPLDLFPEFFKVDGIDCTYCNLDERIPLDDEVADVVICQEGIEHLPNQLKAFKEFSRILKPGGKLIITTPNYSNLKAKLSYLLTESEYFNKIMPPNEVDDLWFADGKREMYYGHLFLIGIQKLRTFGRLNGFNIHAIYPGRVNGTALFLTLWCYPFMWLSNLITLRKNIRKKRNNPYLKEIKGIYQEIKELNLNFKVLTGIHLFIEFEKSNENFNFSKFKKHADTNFVT
jgi:SAM-dependent methyltransferase